MTKTIVALLIIGVVAVGGYELYKRQTPGAQPVVQDIATVAQTGKKVPFTTFIKDNGSYQCTVHQVVSDMDNNGIVYVSNGDIRGEFSTITEGRSVSSSIIVRDGSAYTWSDAMPTMGFKMTYSPDISASASSSTYMWNVEQVGDYDCKPWVRDEAKFTPPTTINFQIVGRQ